MVTLNMLSVEKRRGMMPPAPPNQVINNRSAINKIETIPFQE